VRAVPPESMKVILAMMRDRLRAFAARARR
jgi:hypothetical protein